MWSLFLSLLLAAIVTAAPASESWLGSRDQRAQILYENFLLQHPTSIAGHANYAEFLAARGNLPGAIAHWRTAQYLAPEKAAIANSLGGAYLRLGLAAKSATQFARAVRLEMGNPAYHFDLANVEFMFRHDLTLPWQMEEADILRLALREFRAASRLAPEDIEYARAYAETFYGVPNSSWSEAKTAWQHVLSLSPGSDFAYLQLARVSLKQGNAQDARQFLNKIVDVRHDEVKRKLLAQAERL